MFLTECIRLGKRIALPCIDKNYETGDKGIVAREVRDFEADVVPGVFNILEPDRVKCKMVNPSELDFIVVPGVAFDKKRNRLGFGAGYYDKYLPRTREDCIKVGIAYAFQVVDELQVFEHDIKMDLVISE